MEDEHTTLHVYMYNKWGKNIHRKMYMHCYRTTLQIIPCNTSNGIEGINSQLKNVEGMKGGNIKLHQFCRKMNMDTFPEHKRKYELAQLSAADMDLGQRPDEKPYLINRPRRFMNG